ncbi:carboxylating nicotinate-nucleotide diphosphorylase [Emcibacter sp. SYSU 3D8]|uniref:carboxylating nicotinate-nucleotide diphosphorylase n=1 Tax=Emcibacter sp. SYSU 3D8 TaxID=3133969 RepID=UPI0031FE5892
MSELLPLSREALDDFITRTLAEDVGTGDVTAEATIPETARFGARIAARETLVVAGLPVAIAIVERLAPGALVDVAIRDGQRARPGDVVVRIEGPARALLTAERSALNILQHLSGVATLTRSYVDLIAGTKAQLLDTRKTIPGLRVLEKYAVKMGGGTNHRMGLYDAVLIKDNHIAVAGGVTAAVTACRAHTGLRVQVECDTLVQAREAIDAGADSLLLDNMSLDQLREAVSFAPVPLEASGGVNLQTIRAIAETGVDFISVGRLTQSAPAIDLGMDFESLG